MAKFKYSKDDLLNKELLLYPIQLDAAGISQYESDYTLAQLEGLVIYNKDTNKLWFHNGADWEVITSAV
jgi:hypothetical protein